ncbi:hypothetical protein F2P79_010694 [Pimephales promelas]|nr:hypothetical protein F2P79_010694 [Pimephales promelas]
MARFAYIRDCQETQEKPRTVIRRLGCPAGLTLAVPEVESEPLGRSSAGVVSLSGYSGERREMEKWIRTCCRQDSDL